MSPLSDQPDLAPQDAPGWKEHLPAAAAVLAGLAVALWLISMSDGFYHDDDITHYDFARGGWTNPHQLWYRWARPGYNLPTAVVAHYWGILGCRIFSALQTAGVALLAYLIARRIGAPRLAAAAAPILVWVQPLAMKLACTTLTETTAALYLSLAIWLYLRGNRVWACIAMSPAFITREELLALAPILVVAIVLDALREANWSVRRTLATGWAWACAGVLLWAPLMWIIAAVKVGLDGAASPLAILSHKYTVEYGNGSWGHYLPEWLHACGVGVVALAIAGAIRMGRRAWLVPALAFGLVALHTVIYRFGLFASGGYGRFLIPASGLLAALAAAGLAAAAGKKATPLAAEIVFLALAGALFILERHARLYGPPILSSPSARILAIALVALGCVAVIGKPEQLRKTMGALAAAAAGIAIAVQAVAVIRPLTIAASPLHSAVAECVDIVKETKYANSKALTTHVLAPHLRDRTHKVANPTDGINKWLAAEPGTLFIWDSKYGGMSEYFYGPLYEALWDHGLRIARSADLHHAQAFVRLPDRRALPKRPKAPATGPAATQPGAEVDLRGLRRLIP